MCVCVCKCKIIMKSFATKEKIRVRSFLLRMEHFNFPILRRSTASSFVVAGGGMFAIWSAPVSIVISGGFWLVGVIIIKIIVL